MKSITARLLSMMPWSKGKPVGPVPAAAPAAAPQNEDEDALKVEIAGSRAGWLRVLDADELLRHVHARKVLKKIWLQSRQSEAVFRRDFLPALRAYAEFVQLMPASEAHHHAHVGGLLSHTLEMVLAALTWRNGHLLPEGEVIEVIDTQRDHWTYVVFFAALLHDVAKPMTDLRISWRTRNMATPLRWAPLAGNLKQVAGHASTTGAEYLVDFTPKAARDYSAHSRMAQLLLPAIAPSSAMAFLSTQPRALDALNLYLSGQDKGSLVAQLVRRADALSARRALQSGSQARFATAKAVPLIDLLMQAIGAMLRGGTSLPLNRSGAAGWVHDGAIWFVAKRLADATRDWIQKNEPDQTVPGETKNDRLFDTWQDYGLIERNPHSGQAIWHVAVHGQAADGQEQGAYTHSLSMLKFPLAKVFADPEHYPEPMQGYIEVKESKDAASVQEEPDPAGAAATADDGVLNTEPGHAEVSTQASTQKAESGSGKKREHAPVSKPSVKEPSFNKAAAVREPAFNKPKPAAGKPTANKAAAVSGSGKHGAAERQPAEPVATRKANRVSAEDAADLLDAPVFEEAMVTARTAPAKPPAAAARPGQHEDATTAPKANHHETGAAAAAAHAASMPPAPRLQPLQPLAPLKPLQPRKTLPGVVLGKPAPVTARSSAAVDPEPAARPGCDHETAPISSDASGEAAEATLGPEPVILRPKLPKIPGAAATTPPEPSQLALDFIEWLQQSLVDREIKYNETGAAVHFVPQGMALVSPLIFKLYAGTLTPEAHKIPELATQVQRAVIKAAWHLPGPNKTNIVRFAIKRGEQVVSHLSTVVLVEPGRFVQPVPPSNPVLELV